MGNPDTSTTDDALLTIIGCVVLFMYCIFPFLGHSVSWSL